MYVKTWGVEAGRVVADKSTGTVRYAAGAWTGPGHCHGRVLNTKELSQNRPFGRWQGDSRRCRNTGWPAERAVRGVRSGRMGDSGRRVVGGDEVPLGDQQFGLGDTAQVRFVGQDVDLVAVRFPELEVLARCEVVAEDYGERSSLWRTASLAAISGSGSWRPQGSFGT